jgi:hypothetical protein
MQSSVYEMSKFSCTNGRVYVLYSKRNFILCTYNLRIRRENQHVKVITNAETADNDIPFFACLLVLGDNTSYNYVAYITMNTSYNRELQE